MRNARESVRRKHGEREPGGGRRRARASRGCGVREAPTRSLQRARLSLRRRHLLQRRRACRARHRQVARARRRNRRSLRVRSLVWRRRGMSARGADGSRASWRALWALHQQRGARMRASRCARRWRLRAQRHERRRTDVVSPRAELSSGRRCRGQDARARARIKRWRDAARDLGGRRSGASEPR